MKKMLWIVNPHAGRGAMSGKIIGCIDAFQQAGYEVTLYVTQGAQDATRMVRERAGEFDRIVCAGGDGTLNEVVTGLMESEDAPAARLYSLQVPPMTLRSVWAFPKCRQRPRTVAAGNNLQALDIGRFNERYFNYIAAFGVFTEVSYATPQQSKNIFRPSSLYSGGREGVNQHQAASYSREQRGNDAGG